VPDDDQDGTPDRDDRPLLPATSRDPAVALADRRGFAEDPCEVPVAVAGGPSDVGPFYATLLTGGTPDTEGGHKVDENTRVLDDEGQPIPGLYGGATLGPILAFAYRAAEAMAETEPADRGAPWPSASGQCSWLPHSVVVRGRFTLTLRCPGKVGQGVGTS